jgi:hypothetical protein
MKLFQMAVTKKVLVKATNGNGVEITLKRVKGKPFLNGIKLSRLSE